MFRWNGAYIAVTVTCHRAGHKLFVAVRVSARLTATVVATAAHTGAGVLFRREYVNENLKKVGKPGSDAVKAQS